MTHGCLGIREVSASIYTEPTLFLIQKWTIFQLKADDNNCLEKIKYKLPSLLTI